MNNNNNNNIYIYIYILLLLGLNTLMTVGLIRQSELIDINVQHASDEVRVSEVSRVNW